MKKFRLLHITYGILSSIILLYACDRSLTKNAASFPSTAIVFDDAFSDGLNYSAFGGSNVTAFEVDNDVSYQGESSMRFDIPNTGNINGSYAGGVLFTETPRNLTQYDALTFWLKASQSATIDLLGFGNDLDKSDYLLYIADVSADTKWTKIIIPIPDASRLVAESGLFYYSDSPDDNKGYTFWIDEIKFEELGTIAHAHSSIFGGLDISTQLITGVSSQITDIAASFNLPSGVDQAVVLAPSYFDFYSSDANVATIDSYGNITIVSAGETQITAQLANTTSSGSATIQSSGSLPTAPTPTHSSDSVISLFSDHYDNVTIDTWNTYWEFSTTQISEFETEDDELKYYTALNFVGVEFISSQIDATQMTHLHLEVYTQDSDAPLDFKVEIIDFGDDGTFGGDDDNNVSNTTTLTSGQWTSIDIELSSLASRAHLSQLVFSDNDQALENFFLDNVYLYNSGAEEPVTSPTEAAPTPPSRNTTDVISIFSESYTSLEGTEFNPPWGQSTVYSTEDIDENTVIKYSGLDYQGTQLGSNIDVSGMHYLHIDYWSYNSTALNIYLVNSISEEVPYALSVPTTGWASVDIDLSNFSEGMSISEIMQFKFDGNGDIYIDNIYFYKETSPSDAAPTPPTRSAENVIAIFSESYEILSGINYNPGWGQSTIYSTEDIVGNTVIKYTGLNYQGLEFPSGQDMSTLNYLHIDYWSYNSTALNVYLVNSSSTEVAHALTVPTSGWESIDIPLSNFSNSMSITDVIQMKFDGNGDIYLDNIYFYKE